jgi:putative salt-induced outer membrane protein YdiY
MLIHFKTLLGLWSLPFCLNLLEGSEKDRMLFHNGDRISGQYLGQAENLLFFEADLVGLIKVPVTEAWIEAAENDSQSVSQVEEPAAPESNLQPVAETEKHEAPDTSQSYGGLNLLWQSAERTLNLFVHDRIPSWYPSLPDGWTGKINLGLNFQEAETINKRYYGDATIEGIRESMEFRLDSHFAFAEQNLIPSENEWGMSSRFRLDMRDPNFMEGQLTHDHDSIGEVRKRSSASIGYGFKPLLHERFTLDCVAGGAFQIQESRLEPKNQAFLLNLNENLKWKINPHMNLVQSLRFFVSPTSWDEHYFRMETGLETLLIGAFNLSFQYRLDYDAGVAEKSARRRTRIMTTLGVKF